MSRKRWKRLTKKGKDEFVTKMNDLQLKLTDLENNWEKIYDLEETINDNIKSLFECDAECTSCTIKDVKACLLNFRKANVFYLGKIKSYEEFFFDAVQYLGKYIRGFHQFFIDGSDPDDIDLEELEKEESEKGRTQNMFS